MTSNPSRIDPQHLAAVLVAFLDLPRRMATLEEAVRGLENQVKLLRESPGPRYLGVADTAKLLGVSVATVRRQLRNGQLPYVRVGRSIRIEVSKLRTSKELEAEALERVRRLRSEIRG